MQRATKTKGKPATLKSVIARIPGWSRQRSLKTKALGGVTNKNYLVTVRSGKFVLRLGRENADRLGIDRPAELAALQAAAGIGVGPELLHYLLPEGHLVTRFIEQGRPFSVKEYRLPANLRRVVKAVRRIHELPELSASFSPFHTIQVCADQATAAGLTLPPEYETLLGKTRTIEARQQQDGSAWRKFCHNALSAAELLDDGEIRILDWEYAGIGDLYYDLAGLIFAFGSDDPLPYELEEFVLESYFGTVRNSHRIRLHDMEFMLNFVQAMRGLQRQALVLQKVLPATKGWDGQAAAQAIFEGALQSLSPGQVKQTFLVEVPEY